MDIEAELLKSHPKEELEELARGKIHSFHGFLTREVALRLIAKEEGLLREERKERKLSGIGKGEKNVSFRASIGKIWPVASYSSGKRTRVVELADETGKKPLVLWNDDVSLANAMKSGDLVMVRNAYEKGGELHLGYSGSVEMMEKAPFPALSEIADGSHAHARGIVSRIEGHDTFILEGKEWRGFAFAITDGKSERRCVIIGGMDRAGRIKEGDQVRVENALVESGNLYIMADSRIMARPSGLVVGVPEKVECDNETLKIALGGKEYELGRADALALLGARVAPDILLSTVVALKKNELLNNRLALHIQDGRVVVRG